jgi:hypothetical protein
MGGSISIPTANPNPKYTAHLAFKVSKTVSLDCQNDSSPFDKDAILSVSKATVASSSKRVRDGFNMARAKQLLCSKGNVSSHGFYMGEKAHLGWLLPWDPANTC